MAASSQGSGGLAGLTPFLHPIHLLPSLRRRLAAAKARFLLPKNIWDVGSGEGRLGLPALWGCHARPTLWGCTGSWGPSCRRGELGAGHSFSFGGGGLSPPSVFRVGECILDR